MPVIVDDNVNASGQSSGKSGLLRAYGSAEPGPFHVARETREARTPARSDGNNKGKRHKGESD